MDTEKDRKRSVIGRIRLEKLMLAAAAAVTVFIMIVTAKAVSRTAADYHRIEQQDASSGIRDSIVYDDGLYGMIGFGFETVPGDPGAERQKEDFLSSSLSRIYERSSSAAAVYSLIITALCALHVCRRYGSDRKGRTVSSAASVLCPYLLLRLAFAVSRMIFRLPFRMPSAAHAAASAAGLLCGIGGFCLLSLLLSRSKRKGILAAAAVPAVFLLFLLSASFEGRFLEPPYTDSFDYLYEIAGEERLDEIRYDEEKNVMVFDGKEYPPETVANPDHLGGAAGIAAGVFEVLDPWSGCGLGLVQETTETPVPAWIYVVYTLKAVCTAAVSFFIPGKREKDEENAQMS